MSREAVQAELTRDIATLRAMTDQELDNWRHLMCEHLRENPADLDGANILIWTANHAAQRANARRASE